MDGVAYKSSEIISEDKAKTAKNPHKTHDADGRKDLPHYGKGILLAYQAPIEESQTRSH